MLNNFSDHGTMVDNVLYSYTWRPRKRPRKTINKNDHSKYFPALAITEIKDVLRGQWQKAKPLSQLDDKASNRKTKKHRSEHDQRLLTRKTSDDDAGTSSAVNRRINNDLAEINANIMMNNHDGGNSEKTNKVRKNGTSKVVAKSKKMKNKIKEKKKLKKKKIATNSDNAKKMVNGKDEDIAIDWKEGAANKNKLFDQVDNLLEKDWKTCINMPVMNAFANQKPWNPCLCDTKPTNKPSCPQEGWEGAAQLKHGSVIKIGCLMFAFSITAFGKQLADSTDQEKDEAEVVEEEEEEADDEISDEEDEDEDDEDDEDELDEPDEAIPANTPSKLDKPNHIENKESDEDSDDEIENQIKKNVNEIINNFTNWLEDADDKVTSNNFPNNIQDQKIVNANNKVEETTKKYQIKTYSKVFLKNKADHNKKQEPESNKQDNPNKDKEQDKEGSKKVEDEEKAKHPK